MYESYWARPDRWGTHSFDDARTLAEQVLGVCGPGRLLDAGCGMGLLVRTLLQMGVDARGCDVARACVEAGNAAAPGRFLEGSLLKLPFEDAEFESVVSTDVLEHLAEEDAARAIAELARVARRNVFLRVSVEPDRDGQWHLTVRPREWWEQRLIEAGLRKHPSAHRVAAYNALDREGPQIALAFEKVPGAALVAHPLEGLRRARDLHMDMSREAGRRSDAHVARYAWAAQFVRPGDTVLDAACGLGYGSAILARTSGAARVLGVDSDGATVKYAGDCFAADEACRELLEFREATLPDLSFLPDASVDVVVSFETLEHVADPACALREFARVLTPGGRVVASVPNDWRDASGKDPNPHHLHVYTWETLAAQLSSDFLLERAAAQTCGGGVKLADRGRRIVEAAFTDESDASGELREAPEAEWWLGAAMKSPRGAGKAGYRETAFAGAPADDGYNLTAFARDYDNPWLVRSMVSIGLRATRPGLLRRLARDTLAEARPGSADRGAALCVLAYREIDDHGSGRGDAARTRGLLADIDAFERDADESPNAWRWRISNRYAAAVLHLCSGDRGAARAAFEACAAMDPSRFSPLLASKTVDAAFMAGTLACTDGDAESARRWWREGVAAAERALRGPWLNALGDPARPLPFGLPEVAGVADLASRCAHGLDMLERRGPLSAQVWAAGSTRTYSDLRRWASALERAKGWYEATIDQQREHSARQARAFEEQRAWLATVEEGRAWAQSRAAARETEAGALRARVTELESRVRGAADADRSERALRERIGALESAKAWLDGQVEGLRRAVADRDASVEQLRAWARQLNEAREWLSEQRASLENAVTERERVINELRAWVKELTDGRDWLNAQRASLEAQVRERERARAWHESEAAAWRAGADRQRARADELESAAAAQREHIRRLSARLDALERCLAARVRSVEALPLVPRVEGAANKNHAAADGPGRRPEAPDEAAVASSEER